MAFTLPDSWVWDFWLADDGALFHAFYLHAPRSLGDPDLRHRNARIGHATSPDLVTWQDHGVVVAPGGKDAFDASATWTGSVVRGPDLVWRMFYTGASFRSPDSATNVESIGMATSRDLFTWTKRPGFVLRADPRWYETLGTSSWPEEAWRDPWVFPDPSGNEWHMLVTARANQGDDAGRGVVGHATSADLEEWQVQAPLSAPQQGFGHLEVPQIVEIDGHTMLVFSCDAPRLTNARRGDIGGVWVAPASTPLGPYAIDRLALLIPETHYGGRIVRDRAGRWVLLAFQMKGPDGHFSGGICDPIPLVLDDARGVVTTAVEVSV